MDNRIKEIREERGVTLDELAERLSTSKGQVAALQAGRRQLTLIWMRRIAEALHCKASDLLLDDDVAFRPSTTEVEALELLKNLPGQDKIRAVKILGVLVETSHAA